MHDLLYHPQLRISATESVDLSKIPSMFQGDLGISAKKLLKQAQKRLYHQQRMLYATDRHSILLVFQAMDAAGKDSTIRSVFSGMNPTGFQVSSFKAPSKLELDHDYLWRCQQALPERGRIGIFNRSHYEEVLVCRVHPEYVLGQRIPGIDQLEQLDLDFWNGRMKQIADWEDHLVKNGTVILKFFLNVSRQEQKRRFVSRIEEQHKNWKFSLGDLKERERWDDYMFAYEQLLSKTSTERAPWFVIPADDKPTMRALVAEIIAQQFDQLELTYPSLDQKGRDELAEGQKILENED